MVPKMWNQGSDFVTGSKYGTLEPVLGTGSAISGLNLSIRRRPAWTDRILFRCNELNYESFALALSPSDYGSHADALDCSDHAPVTAHFEANCFSPEVKYFFGGLFELKMKTPLTILILHRPPLSDRCPPTTPLSPSRLPRIGRLDATS